MTGPAQVIRKPTAKDDRPSGAPNLNNRVVDDVQFREGGIQMGGTVQTGVSTASPRDKGIVVVTAGPGVCISRGGVEYVVPWGNIKWARLAPLPAPPAKAEQTPEQIAAAAII